MYVIINYLLDKTTAVVWVKTYQITLWRVLVFPVTFIWIIVTQTNCNGNTWTFPFFNILVILTKLCVCKTTKLLFMHIYSHCVWVERLVVIVVELLLFTCTKQHARRRHYCEWFIAMKFQDFFTNEAWFYLSVYGNYFWQITILSSMNPHNSHEPPLQSKNLCSLLTF